MIIVGQFFDRKLRTLKHLCDVSPTQFTSLPPKKKEMASKGTLCCANSIDIDEVWMATKSYTEAARDSPQSVFSVDMIIYSMHNSDRGERLSHLPNLEDIKNIATTMLTYVPHIDKEKGVFRDHGVSHCEAVEKYIDDIINICDLQSKSLNKEEKLILKCSSWLHDLGRLCDGEHATNSVKVINKLIQTGFLNLGDITAEVRWVVLTHSSENTNKLPDADVKRTLAGRETIRLRYLCCLFKIADECDLNLHRAPRPVYEILKYQMPKKSQEFWLKHQNIINAELSSENEFIIINMGEPGDEAMAKPLHDLLKNDIIQNELKEQGFPLRRCKIIYREELSDI